MVADVRGLAGSAFHQDQGVAVQLAPAAQRLHQALGLADGAVGDGQQGRVLVELVPAVAPGHVTRLQDLTRARICLDTAALVQAMHSGDAAPALLSRTDLNLGGRINGRTCRQRLAGLGQ